MKKISLKKLGLVFTTACVAGVMAFALAGCGGGSSSSDSGSADAGSSSETLRFVTGGESGTYYAFGSVIAQHATNEAGVAVTALAGNGSQANVMELQDGNAELAFCQSDVMAYAYDGTNLFEDTGKVDVFSTVACLYDEQVQIVTLDENIKTVADLKGKNVSIGAAGSGVYFNAIDILGAYGLTESDINPTYESFADSANSLKDGKIDAAFIVAGAPTTAITELSTSKPAKLVALDDEHVDSLLKSSPYYSKAVIPAGTYDGQDADVTTVAVGAVILAADSVPEDAVYAFVADIFDNAADLTENHAKYAEVNLEKGASITSVPYHAGAAKYFKEKGIEVATK
ncbi:MAG: TAXI family TRAP transporter solute-binding subunit [Coriobacteriaceae bacterium]|nr:TAXI family TRAP transporter solute-binding subunit [Coriobacteriaceae bacterium]